MKSIYDEILVLLKEKGEKLGMNAQAIGYSSKNDPGTGVPGYTTSGVSETITIPDEYMDKSSTKNSQEFLNWLRNQ